MCVYTCAFAYMCIYANVSSHSSPTVAKQCYQKVTRLLPNLLSVYEEQPTVSAVGVALSRNGQDLYSHTYSLATHLG